jgi:peptidyl-prolyl cis-trans isomerase B (cyclophilin B)
MEVELWPDVAPNHARNFLDLAHSGFYEGTAFHRVAPGFMIQGGDPNTKDEKKRAQWGTGRGPRMLKSEFNAKKHERGVLSMARGDDPDSASSQFFVMDAEYPSLDGKYSAFGHLVDGFDALDKIVNTPGTASPTDGTITPTEPPRILKTLVVHISPEKK